MDRNERGGGGGRGTVRYEVYTWVPEDMLAEWNDWHNRVHIPHVLAAPQMKSVRKFRVQDSTGDLRFRPQFVTVYELASAADFETYRMGPGIALKREYDERYGGGGEGARLVSCATLLGGVRPPPVPGGLILLRSLFQGDASPPGFGLSFP